MPRSRSNDTQVARTEEQPTALGFALPDDIRADLLRAQADSIQTPQTLPRVKIMGAGAGLYEFDDSGETTQTFRGVILGNHPRHVLWDRAFGSEPDARNPDGLPACSSLDGRIGTPRPGFAHAALQGRAATGAERIDCRQCPYNQWGSGALLIATQNPRGKAVTNQRSIYIVMEDRESPVELVLPPTSLSAFDEYLTLLLNRHLPVQAVVTEFSQVRQEGRGGNRYAKATFRMVSTLDQETFSTIMDKREQFWSSINPQTQAATAAVEEADAEVVTGGDADDELPF